jgi:tRNA (mo5U34)-methyltransferase
MSRAEVQAQIDRIAWYHDIDFGGALTARSQTVDSEAHRRMWKHIERELAAIDFRDKSVLDIGCWDGYWSFYAEKRGARAVLASDDVSQSWADGEGLRLAKRLLGSAVEIDQGLSVYDLSSLGRTFDIILCLGVYYHLYDPFHAFSEIRHCCHRDTIVVLEGEVGLGLGEHDSVFNFAAKPWPTVRFLPSVNALKNFLGAAYLRVQYTSMLNPPHGIKRLIREVIGRPRSQTDRMFAVCAPFEGANELYAIEPPFGLKAYDDRFRK